MIPWAADCTFEPRTKGVRYAGPFTGDAASWEFCRGNYTIGKEIDCGDWIGECPPESLVQMALSEPQTGPCGVSRYLAGFPATLAAMCPTLLKMWGRLPPNLFIDLGSPADAPTADPNVLAREARAYGVKSVWVQSLRRVPDPHLVDGIQDQSAWFGGEDADAGWEEKTWTQAIGIALSWPGHLVTEIRVASGSPAAKDLTGRPTGDPHVQLTGMALRPAIERWHHDVWRQRRNSGKLTLLNFSVGGVPAPFPLWAQSWLDSLAGQK